MRRLMLIIAAALAALIPAMASAAPYSLGGWTAAAGQPEKFHISRADTSAQQTVDFMTRDGTAHAGDDYTATATKVTLPVGVAAVTVPVPTHVNPRQYGQQLRFGAAISLNGVVVSTAGATINDPPQPANPMVAVDLNGAAPVADNFDYTTELRPSWGTGAIPPDNGIDPVGAFRFICGAGPISYDDPVVYPNQPGASHAHQFYGNDKVAAPTTYSSLRTIGNSSCGNPVNRSGYWMPAMLDGKGNVAQPDYISIYYKRMPLSNPKCNDISRTDLGAEGICVQIPRGIRFIFGYDMLTGTPRTGGNQFQCIKGNSSVGIYATLTDLAKAGCPVGDHIELMISAPTCWNGHDLDTPNHRDHVSYPTYGSWGYLRCDKAHPYVMPRFQMSVFYTVRTGDDLSLWHLSSDEMHPELPHGATFHADYFEGWSDKVMAMWMDNCINKHLNCSGGDLGNGLQIKGASGPSYGYTNPNARVPIPPRP